MDRCALFVDASYALADGAMAVHGTSRRDSVSWNHAGLLTLLAGLAKDRTGLPVLRCYWYELAADDSRTAEQEALAEMPGLKLRLVSSRPGRREGIETQLRRDLVALAKSGGISDAFVVSADDNLAEIVSEVQDLGLRVVVLHISSADGGWTIPQPLRQECDDIVEISGVHLRPFVELVRGAEPAALTGSAQQLPQVLATPRFEPAAPYVNGTGPDSAGFPAGFPAAQQVSQNGVAQERPSAHGAPAPSGPQHGSAQYGSAQQGAAQHGDGQHAAGQHAAGQHGIAAELPQYGPPGAGSVPVAYPSQHGPTVPTGPVVLNGPVVTNGTVASNGAAIQNGAAVPMAAQAPPPAAPQHAAPPQPAGPQHAAPSHQQAPPHQQAPSHQQAPTYQPAAAYPTPPGQYAQAYPAHAAPLPGSPPLGPPPFSSPPVGPPPVVPQAVGPQPGMSFPGHAQSNPAHGGAAYPNQQYAPQLPQPARAAALRQAPVQQVAISLPEAVKAAHGEGYAFGEAIGRDAPGLWLEAVLARKPRMPSDLEARLLQGSSLPIDSLLHDEVRHSLRRGFWDALEGARR